MRSSKFELVAYYYRNKLWNKGMVRQAVGRWITEQEAIEILGEPVAATDNSTLSSRVSDVEEAVNGIIKKEVVPDA